MDRRIGFSRATALVVAGATLALLVLPSHAQSPLGIGAAEPSFAPSGPFANILQWINTEQQAFYRAMTEALKAMRDDGSKLWILVGLSFAYGIFHAAGPGHGKVVISSYMLANEVALKRGVVLSFAAAMLQALVALVVIGAVFLALRGTAISMTDATLFMERVSFALVAAFGGWLLWRKIQPLIASPHEESRPHSLSSAYAHEHDHHHHSHDHAHHHHDHGPHEVCSTCGHAHAPDPQQLSGERFDWKAGWSAVTAVGMRPCSGALIVLTFAFLNSLWLGGVISVFAMALGTAITVSVLAVLAVTAKNVAVAISGGVSNRVYASIEICGALLVLLMGITLLAASLSG